MENIDIRQNNVLQTFDASIAQKPQVVMSLAKSGELLSQMFITSLKNNKSPLLPNEDGLITVQPVWNARTGAICRNITLLALLERRAELKTDVNSFATWQAIYTARAHGVNTAVRKGEQGFNMTLMDANSKEQTIRWLNLSQLTDSKALLDYYGIQPNIDIMPHKVIACSACNSIDYIAQALAAITTCTPLAVTPTQKEVFVHDTAAILNRPRQNGDIDRLAIYHITDKAWKKARHYIETINGMTSHRKKVERTMEECGMSR